jgi:ArsR family transcriptional regulator, arsenate/arsenite/antimonite-responsive transcriptional repressor
MAAQDVFKALADPSRRKVLKILQGGAKSAGEIADHFDMTKGSLSHHFALLKNADLVRCERQGQQQVYSLNTSVFDEVAAMMFDLFKVAKPRGTNEKHDK